MGWTTKARNGALRGGLFGLALLAVASTGQAQPRPVIERIEPASGPVGTEVQLIGRRIHPHSTIRLGQVSLDVLRRLPNRWTVRIPEGAESGQIVIQTRWGSYPGPYFRVTEGRPAPQVDRIEPDEGPPGTEVVLYGSHFSPRIADNTVTLGGRQVVVRTATPTSLRVIVPSGATSGTFLVRVRHAGETRSPSFTVRAGTSITNFDPQVGAPGAQVVIEGTGFSPRAQNNRVYVHNQPARVIRASETELLVQIPQNATTGPILVDVRGGGRAESDRPFRVQQAPIVGAVEPSAGAPGTLVAIRGAHFGRDPRAVRVTLDGRPVILREVRPRRLLVEIPPGATTGRFGVTVRGVGPVESSQVFGVRTPLVIRDFRPRTGPVGTEVTLRGEGFSPRRHENQVTIAGAQAPVLSASSETLRIRVPSTQSGIIEVSVPDGATARSTTPFVITQPPVIAGISPTAGPPGTEVTIRGRNFGTRSGLVRVTLRGRSMPIRSLADGRIVAVVPDGAATGPIVVRVRLQGSATSDVPFQVVPDDTPPPGGPVLVTSLQPNCNRPGCHVLLRGQGFSSRDRFNRVFWGDRPVRVERASPQEILISLPNGAGTHPFRVDVRGSGEAESAPFTIVR